MATSLYNKVKHLTNAMFLEWMQEQENLDAVIKEGGDTLDHATKRWEALVPEIPFPGDSGADNTPDPPSVDVERIAEDLTGDSGGNGGKFSPERQHVPEVLLSESERILASLIAASDEYPDIEVGEVLDRKSALALPEGLSLPEYRYKWVDRNDVQGQLTLYGGRWNPVNRTNHSHFRKNIWGDTGGIIHRGQLLLCYMPRKMGDALVKRTLDEFRLKADDVVEELNKRYHDPSGREVVVVERTKDPGDVGGEELMDDEDYDFGPPEIAT